MLGTVKTTLKHSITYGLGGIGTKLVGVVLLPLYTKNITVSEYGILGILEVTILLLTQVLVLGQPSAYLRFHDLEGFKEKRKQTLFTLSLLLLVVGLLADSLGQILAGPVSSLFSRPAEFALYFRLCSHVVLLRLLTSLFIEALRAKEKASLYVVGNLLRLAIVLGFSVYFVALAKIGVKGILYSYLIGDASLLVFLLPSMISDMTPKVDRAILGSTLRFGSPLVFGSIAWLSMSIGDRYVLKLLVDYKEVGLYDLGYRVAGTLNVFLVQPFLLSLAPIAYKMYGRVGDTRYYAKMLTYSAFCLLWAGLGLALFGGEIIRVVALNPDYWAAYRVVPYITLAYVFSACTAVLSLGLQLEKRTGYFASATVAGAALNMALNFILIPKYKMIGAAVATIISYVVLYFLTYLAANRFCRIPYENRKLLTLLVLTVALFLLSGPMADLSTPARTAAKISVLISFPFLLSPLGFYEKIEIDRIRGGLRRIAKASRIIG